MLTISVLGSVQIGNLSVRQWSCNVFYLQIEQHTAGCLECGKRTAQLLLSPQQREAIGRRHHLKFILGHYGSGKVIDSKYLESSYLYSPSHCQFFTNARHMVLLTLVQSNKPMTITFTYMTPPLIRFFIYGFSRQLNCWNLHNGRACIKSFLCHHSWRCSQKDGFFWNASAGT